MILYTWPITAMQHPHAGRSDRQKISGKTRYLFSAPHLCSGHEWGRCYSHNKIHDWTDEALLKTKICATQLTCVLKDVYYVHTEISKLQIDSGPITFLQALPYSNTSLIPSGPHQSITQKSSMLPRTTDCIQWMNELQKSTWDTLVTRSPALFGTQSLGGRFI